MDFNPWALAYSAIGLGLLGLILNILLIFVLKKVKNKSEIPEVKLIYIIIFTDLTLILICLIQEVLSRLKFNPMKTVIGCQVFGILHISLPLGSLSGVTVLSLNRSFYLYQHHYLRKLAKVIFTILSALFICLCILCAAQNQFEYAPNRMMCMVTPKSKWSGIVLYYAIIIMFILCWFSILLSYTMIMFLTNKMDKPWVKSNYLKGIDNSKYDYTQTSDSITNSMVQLSHISSNENNHDRPLEVLFSNMIKKQTSAQILNPSMSKTVIKSLIIILIYTILLLPSIVILIYHLAQVKISYFYNLSPILSSLFLAFLFSLALINPILMLCLHNRIIEALFSMFC